MISVSLMFARGPKMPIILCSDLDNSLYISNKLSRNCTCTYFLVINYAGILLVLNLLTNLKMFLEANTE